MFFKICLGRYILKLYKILFQMMNFTRDFFRKAVREKKLEQFDIFVDDISHLEIIRVLENVKNNETGK